MSDTANVIEGTRHGRCRRTLTELRGASYETAFRGPVGRGRASRDEILSQKRR